MAIVIALLGLNWVLRSDPSRRNIVIMPDMAQSPAYASFGANENFRDGMTLRGPVPGTVIRGRMPLHYLATPADALRAGRELRSPFAPNDAKILARGKFVFDCFSRGSGSPEDSSSPFTMPVGGIGSDRFAGSPSL